MLLGGGAEVPGGDEEGGDVVCVVVECVLSGAIGQVCEHCGGSFGVCGGEVLKGGGADLVGEVLELGLGEGGVDVKALDEG